MRRCRTATGLALTCVALLGVVWAVVALAPDSNDDVWRGAPGVHVPEAETWGWPR